MTPTVRFPLASKMGPLLWGALPPLVTWAELLVVPPQAFGQMVLRLCLPLFILVSVSFLTPQISHRALCVGTSASLARPSHLLPPYPVSRCCNTNPVKIILQTNLFTCRLSPSVKTPSGRDLDLLTTAIQHLKQGPSKV